MEEEDFEMARKMAEMISQGIQHKDQGVTIKLMNAAKDDKTDILTEVFKSKMVLVGSPTVNNGYLHSIAGILEMMKGEMCWRQELT